MPDEGDNGTNSKKRLRGVCANPPCRGGRGITQSKQFHLNLASKLLLESTARTLDEAFAEESVEMARRFAAMYAKDAVVTALESLGINVHWELRTYSEIVRNPKTAPSIRLEALSKIQSIRSMVYDNRVGPTPKRATSATLKVPAEVTSAMQKEADSAAEQWGPKEAGG